MNNKWIPNFKSIFSDELTDFINFKRANGYDYGQNACHRLKQFDDFLISINLKEKYLNYEIIDKWLNKTSELKEVTKGRYFIVVSTFCKYLILLGYKNIVLPEYNIKYKSDFIPYIFDNDEILKMFKYMREKLRDNNQNYKAFYVMFCLYYGCGLRLSETLNLKVKNFNIKEKYILIEHSKNDITRVVPTSESIFKILLDYYKSNNYFDEESYLFINNKHQNKPYNKGMVYKYYKEMLRQCNIPLTYEGKSQRIHDLRHTFAVNSLKQMEIKGLDLYVSLMELSVYLGHKHITETEYYLRLLPRDDNTLNNKTQFYMKDLYGKKEEFYGE